MCLAIVLTGGLGACDRGKGSSSSPPATSDASGPSADSADADGGSDGTLVSETDGGIGDGTDGGGDTGCPWRTLADLDDEKSAWALYFEGTPTAVVENVSAPSVSGGPALRCGLTGGAAYSNVHCFRNVAMTGDPQAFVLRLSFWYSPPSTFNNVGQASVAQAIEFSLSKWHSQKRYELAVQWQNVGTGAPQWRYWDPNLPSAQRWVAMSVPQGLAGEQWHTLEIRGEGRDNAVHYRSFEIDGQSHPLDLTMAAAAAPGEGDRLAVAVQLDGSSLQSPYDVVIDEVQVATCDGSPCPSPRVFYQDLDGDGVGNPDISAVACSAPAGHVTVRGDCDDEDAQRRPGPAASPTFNTNRCGEGTRLDGMEWSEGASGWQVFTDGLGSTAQGARATGCHDDGMQITYSLAATAQPNWIALRKVLPAAVDLSRAEFLLTPFKGDATGLARTIEIKLEDANVCRSTVSYTSASPLPVFRTVVTSLQQFSRPGASTCSNGPIDLSRIKAIEIGVSENGSDVPSPDSASTATLTFDDFTFVGREALLTPQAYFECVPERGDVLGRVARNFLRRQKRHGFVASWYPEPSANYYTYSEALNLIVFSKEYARTGRPEYRSAAQTLADRLVALQAKGAWVDNYREDASGQVLSATSTSWVGNVAWAIIGLKAFLQQTIPANSTTYLAAIEQARTWLKQQISAYGTAGGAAGGITDGVEGNVSTYFALVAASDSAGASAMANFLTTQAWDTREQHLRMGVRHWGLAIDVMGNWGSVFLRDIRDDNRALEGLGLAAGIFPVEAFDGSMIGMGDVAGPWQPTVEFTGQYAAVGGHGAAWLMDQVLLLEDPNDPGAFPGSPHDFGGGDGWNTAMTGSSPSAWVYLGYGGGVGRGMERR